MRRLLIGLSILALATPAAARDAEALRLLDHAIAAARDEGGLGFRLICAFGCSRPRQTLSRLKVSEVVRAEPIPCRRGGARCYRLDLERTAPMTLWFSLDIEARDDPERPIARIAISGP